MRTIKGPYAAFVATFALAAMAAVASGGVMGRNAVVPGMADTVRSAAVMLPGEVPADTASFKGKPYEGSEIMLTARAYGDRIVLRWAPSDYAAWMRLNLVGYNIYRYDEHMHCDTLALALKPKALEEFRAKYPVADSVATVGYGLIYGANMKTSAQTREEPGSFGSMLELYDDQVTSLAFAVLASEWRQDLAEDMAMRFVDSSVRKGGRYSYIIQPARRFDNDDMFIRGCELRDVVNTPYVRKPYSVGLRDSLTAPLSVTLYWNDNTNSSFEIERRVAGMQEWGRVNQKPYMPMFKQDLEAKDEEVMFVDNVPATGTYEYRIMAHDAFGDTTLPSEVLTVKVGDRQPPSDPVVTMFTEADLGIKLLGRYDAAKDETRLAWSHARVDAKATPYYYCVYRKAGGETGFTFLCSAEPDAPLHTDALLAPGQAASYYVVVRYVDGRHSKPSNIVTVEAPDIPAEGKKHK